MNTFRLFGMSIVLIQHFLRIQTWQTLLVISLSFLSTYLCLKYEVIVELPSGLISVAIVFPIAFSINAAYQRREIALDAFGSIKSHLLAMFLAHRDWLSGDTSEHVNRIQDLIVQILQSFQNHFHASSRKKSSATEIYKLFSDISLSIEKLRLAGMSGSEISRINQYLRVLIVNFETMENILTYRTPTSLKAYGTIFLSTFPILFGPYFAYLSSVSFNGCGFLVAGIYSLVLKSLDNIQDLLENPYDNIGADDVNLNSLQDYQSFLVTYSESNCLRKEDPLLEDPLLS